MAEESDTPKIEAIDAPEIEAGDEAGAGAGHGAAPKASIGDGLELDRMEVGPTEGAPGSQEKAPADEGLERGGPEETEAPRANVLALLAAKWIWGVALLLALSVVSALLWFALGHGGGSERWKHRSRSAVITASLGGEYYAHFRILGPFDGSEGQKALRRAMAKIKNDLILSGGQPEVARSIAQGDMKFLKRYILGIVSDETGVPIEELDLKGLSVTPYSDEEEIRRERGS